MINANDKPLNIIVTGAASGLGAAIAAELDASGHNVIPFDIKDGNDVTAPYETSDWLHNVPAVDVLINCAGINHNEWFEAVSEESLSRVMQTNAFSFVYMTQAVLSQLKASKGAVINIVSNAAHIPMTSSLAYNASKAAALMISKQMAHELTPKYGITVMSVSPNKIRGTEMSKQIEENVCKTRGWSPEFASEYQKKALMHGRESEPTVIAEFIADLLHSGSINYMSGVDIPFGK